MRDAGPITLGPNLAELPKSGLPAGAADEGGAFPFFCSSADVKTADQWLVDGEAVVMGTGGVASVNFGRGRFAYSTDCWAFRSRNGKLGTEYLYRVLQHRLPHIDYAGFEGSGLRHLRKDYVRSLRIDAPDPIIQNRVVDALRAVDDAIEQTEALIAKTQAIKTGLMHDLFTRGVLPNGQLRPPREQAPKLYKESPLGWIPCDWSTERLDAVASVERGKFSIRPRNDPRYYDGPYPFLQTGDVAEAAGRVVYEYKQSLNGYGLLVSRCFPAGAVMVTIAANIGDTCILGIPMCAPDSLVGIVPTCLEDSLFIEMAVSRRKRFLESRAPQTAQKNINLEDLRPLEIMWPLKDERRMLVERRQAVDIQIKEFQAHKSKVIDIRCGLMHDLLTGRVLVPAHDAPAAVQPQRRNTAAAEPATA